MTHAEWREGQISTEHPNSQKTHKTVWEPPTNLGEPYEYQVLQWFLKHSAAIGCQLLTAWIRPIRVIICTGDPQWGYRVLSLIGRVWCGQPHATGLLPSRVPHAARSWREFCLHRCGYLEIHPSFPLLSVRDDADNHCAGILDLVPVSWRSQEASSPSAHSHSRWGWHTRVNSLTLQTARTSKSTPRL